MNTNQIPYELIIGTIGSVLGALTVYLSQSGLRLTKKTRQNILKKREKEIKEWKSMKIGVRQGITNYYLFSILRYLFLGNLLWVLPELVEQFQNFGLEYYAYVITILLGRGGALICFFIGLGQIIRYLKLRDLDEDTDSA